MSGREVRPLSARLAELLARLEEGTMPSAWAVVAVSPAGNRSVNGIHADPIGALRLAEFVDQELNASADPSEAAARWHVSLLPFIPFEEPPPDHAW